jgi:hypothetical protein
MSGERETVTAIPFLISMELHSGENWKSRTGTIVLSPQIVGTPDEKRRLFEKSGAIAVDMESHVVAQVCNRSSIPVSVVRVISDSAAHALPPEIGKLMDESGNPRPVRAIGQIARRPGLLRELLAMEKGNKLAVTRMKELSAMIRASMASSAGQMP